MFREALRQESVSLSSSTSWDKAVGIDLSSYNENTVEMWVIRIDPVDAFGMKI